MQTQKEDLLNKHLKGRVVRSSHTGHKWKVRGLARAGANQTYFVVDEGTPNQHTTTVTLGGDSCLPP